ncbi:unnamed protein product [Arabis nemorensis]|uniref:Uncharacterized protein n=1 Tax=Arabis nemorensis TaxID=586526 RepID=A0A565B409_9BRAS|nr:unnamed protein product [Arabis nemorensis]
MDLFGEEKDEEKEAVEERVAAKDSKKHKESPTGFSVITHHLLRTFDLHFSSQNQISQTWKPRHIPYRDSRRKLLPWTKRVGSSWTC